MSYLWRKLSNGEYVCTKETIMFYVQRLSMRRTLDKSQMLMSEAFLPTAKLIEFLKEETLIYQENWRTGFFFTVVWRLYVCSRCTTNYFCMPMIGRIYEMLIVKIVGLSWRYWILTVIGSEWKILYVFFEFFLLSWRAKITFLLSHLRDNWKDRGMS